MQEEIRRNTRDESSSKGPDEENCALAAKEKKGEEQESFSVWCERKEAGHVQGEVLSLSPTWTLCHKLSAEEEEKASCWICRGERP